MCLHSRSGVTLTFTFGSPHGVPVRFIKYLNPLNAKLNPICHLLALLGAHLIFHVSGLRVNDWSDLSETEWRQVVKFGRRWKVQVILGEVPDALCTDVQRIWKESTVLLLLTSKACLCGICGWQSGSKTGSACLYRASMTIITLYYPTDAQIYNS